MSNIFKSALAACALAAGMSSSVAVLAQSEDIDTAIGPAVSEVNDRNVTIRALEMALKRRCPAGPLLHHSDQGCTYASEDYRSILELNGVTCSMSRRCNCYDNAVMESFFSTVKI